MRYYNYRKRYFAHGSGFSKSCYGKRQALWKLKYSHGLSLMDFMILGLLVSTVIDDFTTRSFYFSNSGGRLVIHGQCSDRTPCYILDLLCHFSGRGMIGRQIQHPEKVISCESGVLSISTHQLARKTDDEK